MVSGEAGSRLGSYKNDVLIWFPYNTHYIGGNRGVGLISKYVIDRFFRVIFYEDMNTGAHFRLLNTYLSPAWAIFWTELHLVLSSWVGGSRQKGGGGSQGWTELLGCLGWNICENFRARRRTLVERRDRLFGLHTCTP